MHFWLIAMTLSLSACEAMQASRMEGRDIRFDCVHKHPDGTVMECHVDGQIQEQEQDTEVTVTK